MALIIRAGRTAFVLLILFGFISFAEAKSTVIKIALLTPEGSTWTKTLRRMSREIKSRTDGEVKFKIYAGGISGDESDVLRKLRVNRLHAAGFSGVGLGIILPEIRILEAPLLYQTDAEIDHVKEKLYDEFAEGFAAKGFVLLGFAEAGFVYFFSVNDISNSLKIRKAKMWVWKDDPVAKIFLDTFGIPAFPLNLTDVNTGLETGMIDSFYASPLAAVAFQWHTKCKFMLDYPMVNSTGALVLKKNVFNKLSTSHQKLLLDVSKKYCRRLVDQTRKENAEAIDIIRNAGIRVIQPGGEQIVDFKRFAENTYEKSIPDLYSRDLLKQVRKSIDEYRKANLAQPAP